MAARTNGNDLQWLGVIHVVIVHDNSLVRRQSANKAKMGRGRNHAAFLDSLINFALCLTFFTVSGSISTTLLDKRLTIAFAIFTLITIHSDFVFRARSIGTGAGASASLAHIIQTITGFLLPVKFGSQLNFAAFVALL
jgi:hypothetical protein